MDVGALSLLISEKGFDATIAKVAALDAAGQKLGAKPIALQVISPTALAVEAALARVGATATRVAGAPVSVRLALTGLPETLGALGGVETAKARVSGTPVTTTATPPNLAPITSALAGLELAKQKAGSPFTTTILPPNVAPALAALAGLETAQSAAAQPVTTAVVAPNIGPAVAALNVLDTEKQQAAQPVSVPVLVPQVGPAITALGTLDAAKIDASSPVVVPVVPPNVGPATAALAGLETAKAEASAPVGVTVTPPAVGPAVAGLESIGAAKATVAQPVAVTVGAPNIGPVVAALGALDTAKATVGAPVAIAVPAPNIGPAVAALSALDAEKAQASAPVTTAVVAPAIAPTVTALGTLEAAKVAASAPVTTPVIAPVVGPAIAALDGLTGAKQQAATPLTVPVIAPVVTPAVAALSALDTAKATVAQPVVITVTAPNVGPVVAGLGALEGAKAEAAGPVVVTVPAPNTGPAVAALGGLEGAKAKAGTPITVPVTPPDIGPAVAALGGLTAAKNSAAVPVTVLVVPPDTAPAVGALAGLEGAKTKAGQPVMVPVVPPDTAPATAALGSLDAAKARAATPVTVPVATPDVGPAVAGFAPLEAEKARVSAPVVVTVTPPNVAPAIAGLSALAEAQALQQTRATALTAALAQVASGSGTLAERAQVLRTALDADAVSTDKLSTAARSLAIADREGTTVIRLRTQATNELIAAQNELSRAQSTGARVRAAPLVGGVVNAVPTGPQLGPATPEAEDFARRSAATKAAFEAEAAAARQAAAANVVYAGAVNTAGANTERLSPKLRTAANGLTAVAFAATMSGGSFQSMALGAGLAASSIASMASGPIALWAAGIGAAVTVGAALIGIFERMSDSAANAATAVDQVTRSIQGIKSVNEARAAATIATMNLARAEEELARAKERANQPSGGGISDVGVLARDLLALRTAQKTVDQFRDIRNAALKKITETEIKDRTEAQAARLGIITQGTAAENNRYEAAAQAFLAIEAAKFATGRTTLEAFFAARLQTIQASGAREIATLRERQALLAEPVADATPAESAQRAAEIRRIGSEIAAVEARTREETAQTTEQRRVQRESLDKAIIAFEQKEQDAAGDASRARIAMAKLEAIEIARTLVQRSGATTPDALAAAWVDANQRASDYVATQTRIIGFQKLERDFQRVINDLETQRTEIHRQVAEGIITEADGNRQVAAAEKARLPILDEILKRARAIAVALGNKDLVAQIDRAAQSLNAFVKIPLGPLAQRLKAIKDELSLAADEGDKAAKQILQDLQAAIDANGGNVTVGIITKAEWALALKRQIEEEFALLEILIKPKNIVLTGVAQAIGQLNQQLGGLALNVGNSIGTALATGFSSAFTKGSGKNFFEAAGNAILSGIGNILVQLGSAMLTYGLLMAAGLPLLLATPFAGQALSAPAAIAAGTGLIALGAGMGAIAANNTGARTGGGASSATGRQAQEPSRIVFDPDKRLREAREVAPRVAVDTNAKALQPAPVIHIGTLAALDPHDPMWQRNIAKSVAKGVRRDLR